MIYNDTPRHQGLRKRLVDGLKIKGIRNERVLIAIGQVPRHLFMESSFINFAYKDQAFPIGAGQTISQPYTVAFQTQLLDIKKNEKILEVGTGSGYQAAVLLEMGAKVFTIERQRELYVKVQKFLPEIGYLPACFFGDGYKGLPTLAPFDKILVTAGAPFVPQDLKIQLDDLSDQMSIFSSDSLWIDLSVIEDLPPMPPIPNTNFDYMAFEKDGEKYMKEWQKEFQKGFGKEYQERMEEWTKKREAQLEKRHAERAKQHEKRAEERSKHMEERAEEREKRLEERAEERAERMIELQQRRADANERRNEIRLFGSAQENGSIQYHLFSKDSLHGNFPNSFYFSTRGKNKNYKVKKTIKIKMPKANKIKPIAIPRLYANPIKPL